MNNGWNTEIAPQGSETLIDGGRKRVTVLNGRRVITRTVEVRTSKSGSPLKKPRKQEVVAEDFGPVGTWQVKRSRDRIKKTGEVFTPPELVDEIIDKLVEQDPSLLTDPSKNWLDPAGGDGAFITRVIDRKIKAGQTPTDALTNSFSIELMPDNVALLRRNALRVVEDNGYPLTTEMEEIVKFTIVQGDALSWDYDNWRPGDSSVVKNSDQSNSCSVIDARTTTRKESSTIAMTAKRQSVLPEYAVQIPLELDQA